MLQSKPLNLTLFAVSRMGQREASVFKMTAFAVGGPSIFNISVDNQLKDPSSIGNHQRVSNADQI
jgi:hypothetical protein